MHLSRVWYGVLYKGGAKRLDNQEKFYSIIEGPSLDILLDIFKYSYSRTVNIEAIFIIAGEDEEINFSSGMYGRRTPIGAIVVDIATLEHEKEDSYSFIIKGHCNVDVRIENPDLPLFFDRRQFTAHYDTDMRYGKIFFN